ncbi:MAG: hypothetical protein IJO39_05100 [Clostridia bacterium]|nr:hypothetical protein [Clostridia bacterium]
MDLKALFSNMSDMRTRYALRLAGRLAILLICFAFCIFDPGQFDVLRARISSAPSPGCTCSGASG